MTLVEQLVKDGIAANDFHAKNMLKMLDCLGLATVEQRLERCKLYDGWKKYYAASKEFTSQSKAKTAARRNAIDGRPVPELPMEPAER